MGCQTRECPVRGPGQRGSTWSQAYSEDRLQDTGARPSVPLLVSHPLMPMGQSKQQPQPSPQGRGWGGRVCPWCEGEGCEAQQGAINGHLNHCAICWEGFHLQRTVGSSQRGLNGQFSNPTSRLETDGSGAGLRPSSWQWPRGLLAAGHPHTRFCLPVAFRAGE